MDNENEKISKLCIIQENQTGGECRNLYQQDNDKIGSTG